MMVPASIEQYVVDVSKGQPVHPKLIVAWWFPDEEVNGLILPIMGEDGYKPIPFTADGGIEAKDAIIAKRCENAKDQAERYFSTRKARKS